MSEPDVFSALADPTRRTVLEEIATRGSATATELAVPLGITRQAVAKHLGKTRSLPHLRNRTGNVRG